MRQALLFGLPLLTPILLYGLWLLFARQAAARAGQDLPRWGDAPWVLLLGAGVVLAGIVLTGVSLFGTEDRDGVYRPPQMIDGKIQPGGMVRP